MTTSTMSYYTGVGTRREYYNIIGKSYTQAGGGDDYVYLDAYDSVAYGEGGRDLLRGAGASNDVLYGDYSTDEAQDGAIDGDADLIAASRGHDTVFGAVGQDYLFGEQGNDFISGGSGGDLINGGSGSDRIYGGTGNDVIYGASSTAFDTSFWADITLDFDGLTDGALATQVTAGVGGGYIELAPSDASPDFINGGEGSDTIYGSLGQDTIKGGEGNDIIEGRAGSDTMRGGDDTDVFLIGSSSDFTTAEVIDGGAGGGDRIRFTSTNTGQTLTLTNKVTNVEFIDISTATGSLGGTTQLNVSAAALTSAVTINGNSGTNSLVGSSLADKIYGNSGNDTINGGAGSDTLDGGLGNDVFRFANTLGASNIDTIQNYVVVDDRFELDNTYFSALTDGWLFSSAFTSNTTGLATTASQRIIYESDTGKLFYDSNGSAAGGTYQQFAQVSAGLSMTASEFFVV